MASPVYQAVSGSTGTAASLTMTEPSGTVSGEGLLAFIFVDSAPSGFTGPASWTLVDSATVTDGTNTFKGYIYAIRRGGSAPSLTASWTGSNYFEWTTVRISGVVSTGNFVEVVASATPGAGTAPNSPSATPLTTNTLAISSGWTWTGFTGSQAQPSGYTLIRQLLNTGNTQAYKTLSTTAAEDPGAWGAGSSSAIWANTLIVASIAPGGPTISVQPSDAQVAVGATASFSVTAAASGGGTLSYQWTVNGSNVGTNSSSYTTGTLAFTDNLGAVVCAVTETGGSSPGTLNSATATLYVGTRRVAVGATVFSSSGGTTVAPAYPTLAANDLLILTLAQKPSAANSGSVTTPSGWALVTQITGATDGNTGGYTTTLGTQTGNVNLYVYSLTAVGSETGSLTVTVATNNVCGAQITSYRAPSGYTFSTAATTGKDTTAGSVSITGGADPGVTAGDFVVASIAGPTNYGTTATFSAQAFSQTGITFGTVNVDLATGSTTGNRVGLVVWEALASSGTSSAAPVWTATAAGTTTNVRGPGAFVRLRIASSGGGTVTASDTAAVTDSAGTSIVYARSASDTASVTDQVSPEVGKSPSDTLTLGSDAIALALEYLRALSDTAPVTDGTALALEYLRTLSDTAAVSDSTALALEYLRALSDTTSVTDSVSAGLSSEVDVTVSDSVSLTDTLTEEAQYVRLGSDALTATDTTATSTEFDRAASDSAGTTDTVSSASVYERLPSDAVAVFETLATETTYLRALSDAITSTDAVDAQVSARPEIDVAVSDTLAVTDFEANDVSFARSASDIVTTADQITSSSEASRSSSDTVAASDQMSLEAVFGRGSSDEVATSDVLLTWADYRRLVDDTLDVQDEAVAHLVTPNVEVAVADAIDVADRVLGVRWVTIATPPDRTLLVVSDDRTVLVSAEDRTLRVET